MRDALAPHLAREMTEQGMDILFQQRQKLLREASEATERIESIESRVAHMRPALRERMQEYEQRIQSLERELQQR